MRRILTFLLLLFSATAPKALPLDTARYAYPVPDAARLYSANFGEMRPDHFHSGVDIKTDGVTGKRVVAAADGYVCRIAVSPWGYGRALYVAHPDGTTTVYGHLSRFRDDIEEWVHAERLRTGRIRCDIACPRDRFPVRRGEQIARSGNTGQSFGPHLHFEVRDTPTQRTLNTIARGLLPVRDDIAPTIVRLHYVEIDTLRGVPVRSSPSVCEAVKHPDGIYRLKRQGALPVGGRGYFVLEATDRKNGVQNTFGLYRVEMAIDGRTCFGYRMDGYTFDRSRYCNAVSCYPVQVASRHEAIRLAQLDGAPDDFYTAMEERGLLRVAPHQRREVRIEVEDDCGNRSLLAFTVEGRPAEVWFHARADSAAIVVDRRKEFRHTEDDLTVRIPAGALYESVFFRQHRSTKPLPRDTTVVILSPVYSLLDASTPMQEAATVSLRVYVPPALRERTVLATRSRKGKLQSLGGGYADGCVTARTRKLGELFVAADTVPPRAEPLFAAGANLRKTSAARFRVSDNFTGIERFAATVDGRRAVVDYLPVQGTMAVQLDDPARTPPARHRLRLEVIDGCGNRTVCEIEFVR